MLKKKLLNLRIVMERIYKKIRTIKMEINKLKKVDCKILKIITKKKEKYIVIEHEGKTYEVLKKDIDLMRGLYFSYVFK
jgi:transcriptional antiterminator Rof (Rho-off)